MFFSPKWNFGHEHYLKDWLQWATMRTMEPRLGPGSHHFCLVCNYRAQEGEEMG